MHGQLAPAITIASILPQTFCLPHIARHASLSYNFPIKRTYELSTGGDNFEMSVFGILHDAIPPPVVTYCEVRRVDK